ncbi:MAG: hypothetical protein AVDCRST_MAG11-159, partial [uncultured Gemmatimonadaceae bacterium]
GHSPRRPAPARSPTRAERGARARHRRGDPPPPRRVLCRPVALARRGLARLEHRRAVVRRAASAPRLRPGGADRLPRARAAGGRRPRPERVRPAAPPPRRRHRRGVRLPAGRRTVSGAGRGAPRGHPVLA